MIARSGAGGTVFEVLTLLLAAAVTASAGLLAAPWLARVAALRTSRQPLSIDLNAERVILSHVLAHPSILAEMGEFIADDFASAHHRRVWEAIRAVTGEVTLPAGGADDTTLASVRTQIPTDLRAQVDAYLAAAGDMTTADLDVVSIPSEARKAGEDVLTLGVDRRMFVGAAGISEIGGVPTRIRQQPSPRRVNASRAWLVLTGALAPVFAALSTNQGLAWVLATIAFLILGAASWIWALVDHDTLLLDFPSFWAGTTPAIVFAGLAAYSDRHLGTILVGLGVVVGIVIALEITNQLYRLVRGTHGLGGGDYFILLATVGVPVTITGSWMAAYAVVMASLVCAIAGFVIRSARSGDAQWQVPFALGPFLATGWVAGFAAWAVIGP